MDKKNINISYVSAVELYSEVEALFHKPYTIDNQTILTKLQECLQKIEELINEEINNTLKISLQQLKHDILQLMEIIKTRNNRMQNGPKTNHPQISVTVISSEPAKPTKNSTANNCEKNEYEDAIRDTVQTPKVAGLKEVAGLEDVKKTLKTLVVLPRLQPQLFPNRTECTVILLYGPPGTGKTRLVHALSSEARATLYTISSSDIISPYIGQSEKMLKALFQHVKQVRESTILFIDEIDAFCRQRDSKEQEHSRRLKTELMCQLSDTDNCAHLYIIGATNCPWDLDVAILRRFHRKLYVPLPDRRERLEFIRLFTKNLIIENRPEFWNELLDRTDGYTGSDLNNLLRCATDELLCELEDTKIWKLTIDGFYEPVTKDDTDYDGWISSGLADLPPNTVRTRALRLDDFINATLMVGPSVPPMIVEKYQSYK